MNTITTSKLIAGVFASLAFTFIAPAWGGTLAVTSVSPSPNSLTNSINSTITINFNMPLNPATVSSASFRAFGHWSGPVGGTYALSNRNQAVTLSPDAPFSSGESVMVFLSHNLQAADSSPLRAAGYSFRFWTRTRPACFIFNELDVMSNQSDPPAQTRIYGALGSDLDNDGWLDIVTINEVSADLRVFMNKADGTGLYHPWLQPPAPAVDEISPNEPADFNNDGNADVVVVSNAMDRVLIFLGNGNGTYGPAQIIVVGDQPRGVAVLDFDGDGDPDIVNGNLGSNNLSRMVNNGAGVFSAPTFFEGGVNGEYGIAAADMDSDGIMDLAVGGNVSEQIAIRHGNGNGTFSALSVQDSGGWVWQIGVGDVNGDGLEDVHTANSFNNSGSILLNTGGGSLGLPNIEPTDGHTPSTDLGDFDGDGDLDWLLSSFGGGLWRLFINDGAGNFTVSQDFTAPNNPACGTAMDIDNDHDLDIVLIDEIADVVILMQNFVEPGDTNCDNIVDVDDLLSVINTWGPCSPKSICTGDLAPIGGNDVVDVDDLLVVINNWT